MIRRISLILMTLLCVMGGYASGRATLEKNKSGVRLTPAQVKTVEAVIGKRQTPLTLSVRPETRNLSGSGICGKSPSYVSPSGSFLQGYAVFNPFAENRGTNGWYEFKTNGDIELRWVYEGNGNVGEGSDDLPDFPLSNGFLREGHIYGFHSEMLYYWLIWGHGIFSLDGEMIEYEESEELETDFSEFVISCGYDPEKDIAYVFTLNSDATGYMLQSVNPDTWEFKVIKDSFAIEDVFTGIAYNPVDKEFYGFTADSRFAKLNTENGDVTPLANLPLGLSTMFQGMVYSPIDKCFVLVYGDGYSDAMMIMVDPDTYEMTKISDIPGLAQVRMLVTEDKTPESNDPLAPEIVSAYFTEGNLFGIINLQLPSKTFGGESLSHELDIYASVDGTAPEKKTSGTPGTVAEVKFSDLTSGNHSFTMFVKYGDYESPSAEYAQYIGLDTPCAPENIVLEGGKLFWDKVTTGINGGFIDTDHLTYNVYLDGEKLNPKPISDTCYFFDMPSSEIKIYSAQVECDNHGLVSERGISNNIKYGAPLKLPVSFMPTAGEFDLFTVYNTSHPMMSWRYDQKSKTITCSTYGHEDETEVVFLPPVFIPQTTNLTELSFSVKNGTYESTSVENLEILFGTTSNVEEMKIAASYEDLTGLDDFKKETIWFNAMAESPCYIAFRTVKTEEGDALWLQNINVSVSERSRDIPNCVKDVKVIAAPKGDLKANVVFSMPLIDASGENLPEEDLTAWVKSEVETVSASGKPGESMEIEVRTSEGMNTLTIWASNRADGISSTSSIFTGEDMPVVVSGVNVTPSADRKSMHVEWTAPTQGANGGYVDSATVEYDIYVETEPYVWERLTGVGTECSYDYTPEKLNDPMPVSIGILSKNEKGSTRLIVTASAVLGIPYGLPISEDFNGDALYNGFVFTPILTETGDPEYENIFFFYGGAYPYVLEAPSPYGAAAYIANRDAVNRDSKAILVLPPFTTIDEDNVSVEVPIYCSPLSAAITVTAESYGMDKIVLGTFGDNSFTGWKKVRFTLPSTLMNKEWVVVNFETEVTEKCPVAAFADYRIGSFPENDKAIISSEIPSFVNIGETHHLKVIVENIGLSTQSAPEVICEIVKDKDVKESFKMNPSAETIGILETIEYGLDWEVSAEYVDNIKIRALITEKDDDKTNNTLQQAVGVNKGNSFAITDLKATLQDSGNVELAWTPPTQDNTFESFENYSPFSFPEKIGDFKSVDVDGLMTNSFAAFTFPHQNEPKAWQIHSGSELRELIEKVGAGDAFETSFATPPTGDRYATAFAPYSVFVGENLVADDWFISPEIEGGSQVSFMMFAMYSGDMIDFLYSSTTDEVESFIQIERIYTLSPQWREYQFTLPEDARYFALRYTGTSDLGFFVAIDDIHFSPVEKCAQIMGYDIYKNNNIIAENVGATELWTDLDGLHEEMTYYNVVPVTMKNGVISRGLMSNTASAAISDVDEVMADPIVVTSGKNCITISNAEGRIANVYQSDGVKIMTERLITESERINLIPGFYVLVIDDKTFKVVVR